jgi:hypothetical protein
MSTWKEYLKNSSTNVYYTHFSENSVIKSKPRLDVNSKIIAELIDCFLVNISIRNYSFGKEVIYSD